MSLYFRSTQVAAPSVAPSSDTSGGAYYVAHRRVNLDGGVTLWSPPITDVALPATITPQSYGDSDQLLRDEILISDDFGGTWRIVTRPTNETGALAIAAFDSGWTVTTDGDTQASTLSTLNFGTFSALSSPSQTCYLYNEALSQGSLTFNFLDAATAQIASDYSGLIQVEILGVIGQRGINLSTTYNSSFLWVTPGQGLNTLALILPNLGFAKIRLTLTNFPTGGLAASTVQLSAQVVGNQKRFPLSYGIEWADRTLLYAPKIGFDFPFVSSTNGLSVAIAPFLLNYNGILVGQFSSLTLSLQQGVGDYTLTVNPNGTVQVWHSTETVPTNTQPLATFTTSATPPYISTITYAVGFKPQTQGEVTEPLTNMFGRFITIDSSNDPQLAASDPVGVYVGNGYYASGGAVLIETQATVAIGDRLSPTTDGYAAIDANGILIARSADYFGFVVADFFVPSAGFADPMTTAGDLIIRNGANTTTRLGIGSAGQLLTVSSGVPTWGSTLPNGAIINGVAYIVSATKPTTRPDSSALVTGDRWHDTTDGIDWGWNGTYWLSPRIQNHSIRLSLSTTGNLSSTTYFPEKIFVHAISFSHRSAADGANYHDVSVGAQALAGAQTTSALATFSTQNNAADTTLTDSSVNTLVDHPTMGFIYVSVTQVGSPSSNLCVFSFEYSLVAP